MSVYAWEKEYQSMKIPENGKYMLCLKNIATERKLPTLKKPQNQNNKHKKCESKGKLMEMVTSPRGHCWWVMLL